jgi:hypothetical protein
MFVSDCSVSIFVDYLKLAKEFLPASGELEFKPQISSTIPNGRTKPVPSLAADEASAEKTLCPRDAFKR